MTGQHERKKSPEITIRQMERDDLSAVYHLGEALFTSEKLPILYRTWDPYEVTEHFTYDPEYCMVAETDGRIVSFCWPPPSTKKAPPGRNTDI
jgi:ribosomal protein S18 acetylase RimI-like enzyme